MSRFLVHFDVGDPGLHVEIVDFLEKRGFEKLSESVYEGSIELGPQMSGLRPKAIVDFVADLDKQLRSNAKFGSGDADLVVVEWASAGTIVPERITP